MAHRPQASGPRRVERQGILADDLTGAGDTALQFFASGLAGEVWVWPELHDRLATARPPDRAAVLALNTETRHLLPGDAAVRVDRAARVLLRAGCTRFYQKVDSTLRGNLAAEILQVLRTLELELAVVAPAFPQSGRITVGGYQLVDGIPVNASVYGRDPITPVKHCHLPTLLAEQAEPASIGLVELRDVMLGPEAIVTAIVRAVAGRKSLLVVDAARAEDLGAIARAMSLVPYRLLPVGSAGLARAMQPHQLLDTGRAGNGAQALLGPAPPVLVAAGSLNPVTRTQVEAMSRTARVVELDVRALLLGDTGALEHTFGLARQLLLGRQDVVLTTAASEAAVRRDAALARDLALGSVQAGTQVAAALGQVTARLAAEADLSGLILAGGDTAVAVCRALGAGRATALRVVGELMPAIPLGRMEGPRGPLRVVTKSGGFGPPDALVALGRSLKLERDG